MTNPAYFALYARRRMDLYGATSEDFAQVKVKNARHGLDNPNARYRKEVTVADVLELGGGLRPAAPARHLRHLRRRGRGGAEPAPTTRAGIGVAEPGAGRARSRRSRRRFPNTVIDMPLLATDPRGAVRAAGARPSRSRSRDAAYEEAGIGPDDVDVAEVYDLSTALELDWIEDLGLCKRGEAEPLLRAGDTTIGGRIPVNPSGGLACFGEAVPAQALAQVCEVTWQLRGQAEGRQVEGARVGITANQGLFGHGSSVHPRRVMSAPAGG